MLRNWHPLACLVPGISGDAPFVRIFDHQVAAYIMVHFRPVLHHLVSVVERSHRSDEQEFYQLLGSTGDGDLNSTLAEWEQFYNLARPHGAHNGKTPYEALKKKLQ